MARTLAVQPTGGTPAYVAVALTPRDALLDAMAFSRGRFIVEQAGAPTLVIPAWAEVPRVTEDCAPDFTPHRLPLAGVDVAGGRRKRIVEKFMHYKTCFATPDDSHKLLCPGLGTTFQQAKGGDPMSHGSAKGSVQFVRGTRR